MSCYRLLGSYLQMLLANLLNWCAHFFLLQAETWQMIVSASACFVASRWRPRLAKDLVLSPPQPPEDRLDFLHLLVSADNYGLCVQFGCKMLSAPGTRTTWTREKEDKWTRSYSAHRPLRLTAPSALPRPRGARAPAARQPVFVVQNLQSAKSGWKQSKGWRWLHSPVWGWCGGDQLNSRTRKGGADGNRSGRSATGTEWRKTKRELMSGGQKHRRELLKVSVTPVTFSTNTWSPDSHFWMLHGEEDRFSHALAREAVLLLPQPSNEHRDTGNFSDISVRSTGESDTALLPGFWVCFPY